MFCSQCGHGNVDGAAFCSACGSPLTVHTDTSQPSGVPPQQIHVASAAPKAPYEGYYAPCPTPAAKKKKTGLILGLSLGGAALLALAAVLLFLWPGWLKPQTVLGMWVSEARGEVLEFRESGSIRVYTASNEFKGRYAFSTGTGTIEVEDNEYRFAVSDGGLYVENMGNYTKVGEDFDFDGFMDSVAVTVAVPEIDQALETLPVEPDDIPAVESPEISAEMPAEEDAVSDVIIEDADAVPATLTGIWYETTGYGGTIEFFDDGTYLVVVAGVEYSGTYTYDPAFAMGTVVDPVINEEVGIQFEDGLLRIESIYYTRDYVEQYDWNDIDIE